MTTSCRFSVAFIKKFIDLLALHKLNVFHWHLTEDQGWRIEIRSHPLLTRFGAYRGKGESRCAASQLPGADAACHMQPQPMELLCRRYGGFYTQDQVRDIVKYASERFVEVVPEIEMPGHCCAALACYPELSCTGKITEVPTQWGVQSDVYCAGLPSPRCLCCSHGQPLCAAMAGQQTRRFICQSHPFCCKGCHQTDNLECFARTAARRLQCLAHPCLDQWSVMQYASIAPAAAAGAPRRQPSAWCTVSLPGTPSAHSATGNRAHELLFGGVH